MNPVPEAFWVRAETWFVEIHRERPSQIYVTRDGYIGFDTRSAEILEKIETVMGQS